MMGVRRLEEENVVLVIETLDGSFENTICGERYEERMGISIIS